MGPAPPKIKAIVAAAALQVVDEVAHAVGLGLKVTVVVLVGRHLDGNASLHLHPRRLQAVDLERVVGHEPDALENMGVERNTKTKPQKEDNKPRGHQCGQYPRWRETEQARKRAGHEIKTAVILTLTHWYSQKQSNK